MNETEASGCANASPISRVISSPWGGASYHFEWGQYQDDVADLAAVLPPVLRPLQAGDAHVTPLEMLHVAAGAERGKDVNVSASPHLSGDYPPSLRSNR